MFASRIFLSTSSFQHGACFFLCDVTQPSCDVTLITRDFAPAGGCGALFVFGLGAFAVVGGKGAFFLARVPGVDGFPSGTFTFSTNDSSSLPNGFPPISSSSSNGLFPLTDSSSELCSSKGFFSFSSSSSSSDSLETNSNGFFDWLLLGGFFGASLSSCSSSSNGFRLWGLFYFFLKFKQKKTTLFKQNLI